MHLSKSRYTQGVQCPKALWMHQHMPEQFDDSALNKPVLTQGNIIGDLAMGYFGDFVEVPFSRQLDRMVKRTRELIEAGVPVICEASFAYDGNFCSVDILRMGTNGVDLIEVKSSTSVKDIHLHDVAYQMWVVEHCELCVNTVSLMYINKAYVRDDELDLQELFKIENLTENARARQQEVGMHIADLKRIADSGEEPDLPIGRQCDEPYTCGYAGWCWRKVPRPNVLDVNNLRNRWSLFNRGIVTLENVDDARVALNQRQRKQIDAELQGRQLYVDADGVRAWLDTLEGPLYFFDFETFMPAVPPFCGTRPYQQIPSQYSLHIVYELGRPGDVHDDGESAGEPAAGAIPIKHLEFLGRAGEDPRRPIAEAICRDIPAGACCIAWNMQFERSVIKKLADTYPDLAEHLLSIHDGFHDLIVPFRNGSCYARGMGGSNSIKAVLPALFPDDPELDYQALDGVHHGSEASVAFETLAAHSFEEQAEIRRNLLRYCRLDTLAMVRIWERLRELAEGVVA